MLALSLGGFGALLTQPRALGTAAASRDAASRSSGHVRCLIKGEVDEAAMLAASTFPIKPTELIERAKVVLDAGVGTRDGGACLAPDFEFCAAVVGPLGREEYLGALGSFKLEEAFPDINPNYYGFFVDPFEPHRVWFTSRSTGTHTGPLLGKPPTGKKVVLPPQQFHLDFAPDGLLREIGFYTVDRRQGNTGGLGGAFGYFYGTGNPLPIPECQPYKKSKRFRLLNLVGKLGAMLKPKAAAATGGVTVVQAMQFMQDPTVSGMTVEAKASFLASKGVDAYAIAQAACVSGGMYECFGPVQTELYQ